MEGYNLGSAKEKQKMGDNFIAIFVASMEKREKLLVSCLSMYMHINEENERKLIF